MGNLFLCVCMFQAVLYIFLIQTHVCICATEASRRIQCIGSTSHANETRRQISFLHNPQQTGAQGLHHALPAQLDVQDRHRSGGYQRRSPSTRDCPGAVRQLQVWLGAIASHHTAHTLTKRRKPKLFCYGMGKLHKISIRQKCCYSHACAQLTHYVRHLLQQEVAFVKSLATAYLDCMSKNSVRLILLLCVESISFHCSA